MLTDRVVMFMDVHHSSIALSALAGGFAEALQEMYETLGDIIVAHQGEIVKYMGDAILCLFPAGAEDQAVKCALQLRRAFGGMAGWQGLPGDSELEIGIGSGPVTIGVFGHQTLRQRDAFGEEVNRVAILGHHQGIALTERVYDRVKESYPTRRLPEVKVKWQPEPLKAWEIVES